jgi:hypothetical protein
MTVLGPGSARSACTAPSRRRRSGRNRTRPLTRVRLILARDLDLDSSFDDTVTVLDVAKNVFEAGRRSREARKNWKEERSSCLGLLSRNVNRGLPVSLARVWYNMPARFAAPVSADATHDQLLAAHVAEPDARRTGADRRAALVP